jgi:hypothetical protein
MQEQQDKELGTWNEFDEKRYNKSEVFGMGQL